MAKSKEGQKSEVRGQNGTAEVTLQLVLGASCDEAGYDGRLAAGGNAKFKVPGRAHLNLHLGEKAAQALLRMRNACRSNGQKMANGKPVFSTADTLRWLLEMIADEADAASS